MYANGRQLNPIASQPTIFPTHTVGEASISAYDAYSKQQQWKISGLKIRNRHEEHLVLESQDGEPDDTGHYEPGHSVTFSQDEDRPSQQWEITYLLVWHFHR